MTPDELKVAEVQARLDGKHLTRCEQCRRLVLTSRLVSSCCHVYCSHRCYRRAKAKDDVYCWKDSDAGSAWIGLKFNR